MIPAGYHDVVNLLRDNDIKCDMVKKDTVVYAMIYYNDTYETARNPYEGHYPHYNTKVEERMEEVEIKSLKDCGIIAPYNIYL